MNQQRDSILGLTNLLALAAFLAGSLMALVVALYWSEGAPQHPGAAGEIGLFAARWLGSLPAFALGVTLALLGAASFLRLAELPLARLLHASAWSAVGVSWVAAGVSLGAGGHVGGIIQELLPGWWGRCAVLALGVILFVASIYVLWLPAGGASAKNQGDAPDLQAVVKGKSLAEGVSTAEASALLPHAGPAPVATAAATFPAASVGSPREADPRLQGRVPPGAKPLDLATPRATSQPSQTADAAHRSTDPQPARALQSAAEFQAAQAAARAAEPAGADLGWRAGARRGAADETAAARSPGHPPGHSGALRHAEELADEPAERHVEPLRSPQGADSAAGLADVPDAGSAPIWEAAPAASNPPAALDLPGLSEASDALDAAGEREIPDDSWTGAVWEERAAAVAQSTPVETRPTEIATDAADDRTEAVEDQPALAENEPGNEPGPELEDEPEDDAELDLSVAGITPRAADADEVLLGRDVADEPAQNAPAKLDREAVQQSLFEERSTPAHEPENAAWPDAAPRWAPAAEAAQKSAPAPLVDDELAEVTLTPAPARDLTQRQRLVFDAGCLFLAEKRVAVSMLQRKFELDFEEATAVLDELQGLGLLGPYLGGTRRDILLTREQWLAKHDQPV